MNIIFYSAITDEKTKTIAATLEKTSRRIGLELHRSLGSLSNRIRQPMNSIGLVLLHVSSIEELSDLMILKERLKELSIMLILPDISKKNLKIGHMLRPRFIFGPDDSPEMVGQVCEKMLLRLLDDSPENNGIICKK